MTEQALLIIPTYNERNNIIKLIAEVFFILPNLHILVVDDSSPDGTADAVRKLCIEHPNLKVLQRPQKNGLGRAYVEAFQIALKENCWEAIITMDADFSHQPKYLSQMLELAVDKDLIIGSRYVAGGSTIGWERWRRALSYFGNLYCRLVAGLSIRDLTSGFCLYRLEKLKQIDLSKLDSSGYAFQVEMKYQMINKGSEYIELPITFYNRIEGESKISKRIIKEGIIAPWKMIFNKKNSMVKYEKLEGDFYEKSISSTNKLRSWFHSSRHLLTAKFVEKYYKEGMFVVDLGCGNVIWNEKKIPVIGVDVHEGFLDSGLASGKLSGKIVANLESTGLANESVDMVVITEVLEHMNNPQNVVQEIKRILKPGGIIICSVPYDINLSFWKPLFALQCFYRGTILKEEYYKVKCGHINHFSPKTIKLLFENELLSVMDQYNHAYFSIFTVAKKKHVN